MHLALIAEAVPSNIIRVQFSAHIRLSVERYNVARWLARHRFARHRCDAYLKFKWFHFRCSFYLWFRSRSTIHGLSGHSGSQVVRCACAVQQTQWPLNKLMNESSARLVASTRPTTSSVSMCSPTLERIGLLQRNLTMIRSNYIVWRLQRK